MFSDFAIVLKRIKSINGTNDKIKLFKEYMLHLIQNDQDTILPVIYMSIGIVAMKYENKKISVTNSILNVINRKYDDKGCKISIDEVFSRLRKLTGISGKRSTERKILFIEELLSECNEIEGNAIMNIISGNMTIGLLEKNIISALAIASSEYSKYKDNDAVDILKSCICKVYNYEYIIPLLLRVGIKDLRKYCNIIIGTPIQPMLSKPCKSILDLEKIVNGKNMTYEYKLDGERLQIHKNQTTVRIYSRNMEDTTEKYSRLHNTILEHDIESFIIDCEVVAIDDNNNILPFQYLQNKKNNDTKLMIVAFDILHINGKDCIDYELKTRRAILRSHFKSNNGFKLVEYMDCDNIDDIQSFMNDSVNNNCEGLIAKDLSGSYKSNNRSWLKLKKDYLDTMCYDSLDMVILGVDIGHGKREGVYGSYLLGIYNQHTDKYQSVCKIGTGLSDDNLKELYRNLTILDEKPYNYDINYNPNYWIKSDVLVEIDVADFTLSKIHTCGKENMNRGISCRFPRLRRIRYDKNETTSVDQIIELYKSQ